MASDVPLPTVVLIGHGTMAARGLAILKAFPGIEVPLVLADPSDPGEDSWRSSLVKTARSLGFKDSETLLQPKFPHSPAALEKLRKLNPTLIVSLQCQKIIRTPVIETAKLGVVNFHNAPLPLLRGCDPFAWAIHDGLRYMGVTLHQVLDEGIDNGPILCQALWPIENDSTAWDLYTRSLEEADKLLTENLQAVLDGKLTPRLQEPHLVTYHPMKQFPFKPLEIDWSLPARTLSAMARARIFPVFQLPTFELVGCKFYVMRIHFAEEVQVSKDVKPGTVIALDPLTIAALWGALEVTRVRIDDQAEYVDTSKALADRFGFKVGDIAR